jgi:hypothetical protein
VVELIRSTWAATTVLNVDEKARKLQKLLQRCLDLGPYQAKYISDEIALEATCKP